MATRRDGDGRKVVGAVGAGGGDDVAAAAEEEVGKKMPDTAKSTKASAKAETAAGRSPQAGTEGDGAAAISGSWAPGSDSCGWAGGVECGTWRWVAARPRL